MRRLAAIGIDSYMILLLLAAALGLVLPARGGGADLLSHVTFWAVALLFFLYGARLDPSAIRAELLNLRLQALTLGATYVLFPVVGLGLAGLGRGVLGPELAQGVAFLAMLPSTVQSSVAFTSIAGGNVAAAICAASLSNILGVVLTPLLVARLMHLQGGGVSLEAIERIGLQILLPFVVGQALRPLIGGAVRAHRRLTLAVDRGSILLIVYAAFGASTVSGLWSAIPLRGIVLSLAVIALFLALAMAAMAAAGRLAGLALGDRAVLFFCGSTKSLASGLPIAAAIFPPAALGATVLPVMMYHMLQLLVCSVIARRMALAASAPG